MTELFLELVNMRTSFPKVYLISLRIINEEKYEGKNAEHLLSFLVQFFLLCLFQLKAKSPRIMATILFL